MCLGWLANASVFSVMDLQSGYWQLQTAREDRHKTDFITKYGLFEYTKMSFDLCNTPSNSYVSNVYGADLSGNAMENTTDLFR